LTGEEILAAVESRPAAALDLHLRALFRARDGKLDEAAAAFVAAQQWEAAQGYVRAALHTSHQSALTANFGGDLQRLRRYYRETLDTVRRMRNREGIALCLRSLGEIALAGAAVAEAKKAWELSASTFGALGLTEAEQMSQWLDCIGFVT
jgi:hypothetical protein